jgi:DNA-binding Lrp family transcriptional regulator
MAAPIIAALRRRDDLKESLVHTATELAHLASIYGKATASYDFLAAKCHCSRRTVIRHIQRLIDAGIIRKVVIWIKGNFCEVNQYFFLISWDKRPARGGSDKTASSLPRQKREKNCGVKEELENQRKGIRFLSPGSDLWQKVTEEIARLETLVARKDEDSTLGPTALATA